VCLIRQSLGENWERSYHLSTICLKKIRGKQ
jgi:hypothetical protein